MESAMNNILPMSLVQAPGALIGGQGDTSLVHQNIARVLDIAFQPIVDIHSGRVFGFEALLRNVAATGFTSPVEFFDPMESGTPRKS